MKYVKTKIVAAFLAGAVISALTVGNFNENETKKVADLIGPLHIEQIDRTDRNRSGAYILKASVGETRVLIHKDNVDADQLVDLLADESKEVYLERNDPETVTLVVSAS